MTNTIQHVGVNTVHYLNGCQTRKRVSTSKTKIKKCFKYSVQCGICKVYEQDHPERVSHYKSLNDELNWDNVNFPSSYVDIDTFEESNGGKVAVNVYFIDPEEGKQTILLYRQTKVKKEIDVLMDTYKLKQEFKHDKLFLMAIKFFVRREWKTTHHFLKNLHDLSCMKCSKEMREWWFSQNDWTYTFRNREFQVKDILEIFLREYIEELFKSYEKYCNLTEIQDHLQKVANT